LTPLVHLNAGHSLRNPIRMIREAAAGRFRVSSSHLRGHSAANAEADLVLPEPRTDPVTDPKGFASEMLETCVGAGVSLLVPQRGVVAIADAAASFEAAGIDVMTAGDGDMMRLLDDKWEFTVDAVRAGLPIAITRHASDVDSFDEHVAEIREMGLDACIKPPIGVFGAGYWRLDDSASLFSQIMNPDARRIATAVAREAVASASPDDRLLVCEHLPGDEWSVDAVCENGRTILAVARVKQGPVQTLHVDGAAMEIAKATIALFGLSGIVNVQMKERRDGVPALLEVNARMSGGCMLTSFSGVNLPYMAMALRLGIITEDQIPVPLGGAKVTSIGDAVVVAGGDGTRTAFSNLHFGN
jgi:biotin carboxylase